MNQLLSLSIVDQIIFFSCFECSAGDATVPARGKAKIPTDVIVDIPLGAYGRIGKILSLCEMISD